MGRVQNFVEGGPRVVDKFTNGVRELTEFGDFFIKTVHLSEYGNTNNDLVSMQVMRA